ncbi:MAG: hypothetical protein IPG66_00485 [Hydrogenophilales bacterium]|nr:hypothetical protein [Hydrogenophilales bacterium]
MDFDDEYQEETSAGIQINTDPFCGKTDHDRQSSYRSLFRTELDEEAITDIRLALAQGQPLGNDRFSETLCKAAGIRRTQACRGRPAKPTDGASGLDGKQTGFGF